MGSRFVGSDTTFKNELPTLCCILMPAPRNFLPVYDCRDNFFGYVSPGAAQRMLDEGHAVGRGSKCRIRALIATHDNVDLIPGDHPPAGQRYSHCRETRDNVKGVWTFRKIAAR